MMKKFKFDYDYHNDNLFLYDSRLKSKASVELDDFVIDFSKEKKISGIEMLNASKLFRELDIPQKISKSSLKTIKNCMVGVVSKNNFLLIKMLLEFDKKKKISAPLIIPKIQKPSPSII